PTRHVNDPAVRRAPQQRHERMRHRHHPEHVHLERLAHLRRSDERAELPGVQVVVSGFGEQADMVRDGRADVALVSRPFDDHGLETELLYTEPRVAALPAPHELATREVLAADDLAGIPAPRWSRANVAERN